MIENDPGFDLDAAFDEDYLYFYEQVLPPERTTREVNTIWRLLALEPGQTVLDFGCGHGRIANALAAMGARVTGFDRSALFLAKARADAAALGVDVDYIQGDLREAKLEKSFDAALLWFTTLGYFTDAENARVLQNAFLALKPSGKLIIETGNRNFALRRGFPMNHVTRRGDDLLIDMVDYNPLTDRTITERVVVRDGRVRSFKMPVRFYSFAELSTLLKNIGFQTVEAFGQDGEPYTLYATRLIVIAGK